MANNHYSGLTVNDLLPVLLAVLLDERMYDQDNEVGTRDGRRAKELTHVSLRLTEPWKRELLLPIRKHNLAAQVAETMWVLAGRNDVEWLSHYLPRAKDFSDDGVTWRGGYGPRLRAYIGAPGWSPVVDQVAHVINLLKRDPLTRQAVINIYNAEIDTQPGKDIPCNDFIQFTSRLGYLDMHVYIRSNDAIWGWSGINAFEWSALQEVVAGLLGINVGSLHFSVGSFHVYDTHWDKATKIAELSEYENYVPALEDSPRFKMPNSHPNNRTLTSFDTLVERWFEIEEAIRIGKDMTDHIIDFPEPMLQSWLRVIAWWWSGDYGYLDELPRLQESARMSVQPPSRTHRASDHATGPAVDIAVPEFVAHVDKLHQEKHAAYGDSWKRRGEMLGILANIARKIDRLGGGETSDETQVDTAIDLLVYLCKYRWWMVDQGWAPLPTNAVWGDKKGFSDYTEPIRHLLLWVYINHQVSLNFDIRLAELTLTEQFAQLETRVMAADDNRYLLVDDMIEVAFGLALTRWAP